MKHIIAFLLTVALLGFSIVTGRADETTELPSGNYYLSLTVEHSDRKEDIAKNLPVRLTTKIIPNYVSSNGNTFTTTDIVVEGFELGNFVGRTFEVYRQGKLNNGYMALSMTKLTAGPMGEIRTIHLMGKVSNHSATGEGALLRNFYEIVEEGSRFKTEPVKWVLRAQRQE